MLSTVTDELILTILSFVPPLDLLSSVARVSHRYSSLIDGDSFWRCHELSRLYGTDDNDAVAALTGSSMMTRHELQQFCIFAAFLKRQDDTAEAAISSPSSSSSSHDDDGEDSSNAGGPSGSLLDPPSFLEYGSLLVPRSVAIRLRNQNRRRVCVASSTDHVGEGIENVLFDDNEAFRPPPPPPNATIQDWIALWRVLMMQPERWWSSKPSPNQHSNELLLFCLRCPLAIISQVSIKPLKDPEGRNIIYLWEKMVVRAYRLPSELLEDPNVELPGYPGSFPYTIGSASEGNDDAPQQEEAGNRVDTMREPAQSDQKSIEMLLDGHEPVYESPEIAMDETNEETMTELCLPGGVVANVLSIELLGKRNEQITHGGYYACVDKVNCRGIPLYEDQKQRQLIRQAQVEETDAQE